MNTTQLLAPSLSNVSGQVLPRLKPASRSRDFALLGLLAVSVLAPSLAQAEGRTERLVRRLAEGSIQARLHTTLLLGELRDPAAVGPLCKLLEHASPALRAAGALSLGRIGTAESADALVMRLDDLEPAVRIEAARALGELRVAGAISALTKTLSDAELKVRLAAARALGSYRTAEAVAPLSRVLLQAESSPEVEEVARQALSGMRGRLSVVSMAHVLASAPEKNERARAALVLEHLGDPSAVLPLIAALDDAEPFVRMMAARALRTLGDERAALALESLLGREQNERVIRVARSVLGSLATRAAQRS